MDERRHRHPDGGRLHTWSRRARERPLPPGLADGLLLDVGAAAAWQPEVVDAGCGWGDSTLDLAARLPGARILGIDVFEAGVVRLLRALSEAGAPTGVRACTGDVRDLLDALAPGSLRHLQVLFPDPWPKHRQHKRRLVDEAFVVAAARALGPGGTLGVATDVAGYASAIEAAVAATATTTGLAPVAPSVRPPTRYGLAAAEAGRAVHELAWGAGGAPLGASAPGRPDDAPGPAT